ncbi:MAG: ABC transporter ATP-binding protein [Acetobacteraceae bacterium]|jgi:branched-chain amino acid transport system ATP-binding protein|nr:ABC transporter ATP-binding protein [Acetobacteraceae bacterium]
MSAILEVRDLVVRMGAQTILGGVSLTVPEGGIVTVLGSNGVGKTTLMRALSGVYRATSGTIHLQGQDITALPSHAIVRLGLAQAPEGRQIFGAMTVAENLRLGATGDADAALLERILTLFPILRERYRQRAGSLSGGEQQMLCVGRAMMARPKLLLMDEPSLGLAPKLVKQIFDLVSTIRREGTPVLLVEQNARAALRVADYAYVMDGGRIVLEGPARELAEDERVKAAYLGGHAHA